MIVRLLADDHGKLTVKTAEMADRGFFYRALYLFVCQGVDKFKLTNGVIFFTFCRVNLGNETHTIKLTTYIVRICR